MPTISRSIPKNSTRACMISRLPSLSRAQPSQTGTVCPRDMLARSPRPQNGQAPSQSNRRFAEAIRLHWFTCRGPWARYNRSSLMTPVTECRLRVRYAETDQMGVVYYANYLVWMEVGRVELCKACGFNYCDMEMEDGVFLAVAESHCQYRFPARFDDEVVVKTWIEKATTRMVTFAYEMRLAEGDRRLATGYTRHIFVSRAMRPTHLPEKFHALFGLG